MICLQNNTEQPIDSNTKHMASLYELFSFKQLIEGPTRVTLTISSIIDHVATILVKISWDTGKFWCFHDVS